jgi:hypothetical protein
MTHDLPGPGKYAEPARSEKTIEAAALSSSMGCLMKPPHPPVQAPCNLLACGPA